jgi:hypothetical protein
MSFFSIKNPQVTTTNIRSIPITTSAPESENFLDGNTLASGGSNDSLLGACWVFV